MKLFKKRLSLNMMIAIQWAMTPYRVRNQSAVSRRPVRLHGVTISEKNHHTLFTVSRVEEWQTVMFGPLQHVSTAFVHSIQTDLSYSRTVLPTNSPE